MKFIDLFAGIGGFHTALHRIGGECVFASEIDKHARATYKHNYYPISQSMFDSGHFNEDITSIEYENIDSEIPDFDILCGGFPCQPFSQAGFKKGFNDERGNLFFYIANIIEKKQPKAFFLENVRHLKNHDDGNTFLTIQNIIHGLGYSFYYKIVKASEFGLPQHRPRLFMVGFKNDYLNNFEFPKPIRLEMTMSDIWEGKCTRDIGYTLRVGGRSSGLDDRRNWDGYLVDGVERRISPKEGKRMQGFPDDFEFPVSNVQAMKQLGNSVAINAIEAVAKSVDDYIKTLEVENPITTAKAS